MAGDLLLAGATLVRLALDLLDEPHRLYEQATDPNRRHINQAFFERIDVSVHSVEPSLNEPFADFIEAARC